MVGGCWVSFLNACIASTLISDDPILSYPISWNPNNLIPIHLTIEQCYPGTIVFFLQSRSAIKKIMTVTIGIKSILATARATTFEIYLPQWIRATWHWKRSSLGLMKSNISSLQFHKWEKWKATAGSINFGKYGAESRQASCWPLLKRPLVAVDNWRPQWLPGNLPSRNLTYYHISALYLVSKLACNE